MALPLDVTTAADAYQALRLQGKIVNDRAAQLQAQFTSGQIDSQFLLDVLAVAVASIPEITQLAATPGLVAYAQQQLGTSVDLTAAVNSAIADLAALRDAIVAEYPKDTGGYLQDRTFNTSSQVQPVQIPAGNLPNTQAALTTFLASLTT
jgi:hypothetical protein